MHNTMQITVMGVVLALAMGTAVTTAADNPFIGAWKESKAKSTSPLTDRWPKSVIRIFTESDHGVTLTTQITDSYGKKSTTVAQLVKCDGVPHAVTDDPAVDTGLCKQRGERLVEYAYSKGSKTVRSGTMAVSNDGKTMTITGHSPIPKGEAYYNLVHDLVKDKK